jgi:glutamyl-tRNA(Gln) amidotransferase subunit E
MTKQTNTPAINYADVGLTCGVEIHQQLDTSKLFCNCPSEIVDTKPNYTVTRRLRVAKGESGKIDEAVLQELKKEKTFTYHAYKNKTCLVELDEEPPHTMSEDALATALMVAKLFSMDITHELHVMRKTVVDGSNTSGFQRTALLGEDGTLDVNGTPIPIDSLNIEEESAKIVERKSDATVYNLCRLGIPLVEIGTGPAIHTPELARDVCKEIGMVLRSTGKVKRGIGTIRQDVNVSIARGRRVEIKGAQELDMIPTIIDYEILRQQTLANLAYEFRGYETHPPLVDITHLLKQSEGKVIQSALKKDGVVYAIRLEGFSGYLGKETSPGRRIGSEFSDYAKHAAGVKGLFHSDELPKYGISADEVENIAKELNCQNEDGFVLIADTKKRAEKALNAVIERVNQIPKGVLPEVRDARPDGTTAYSRPLPGASRMYPETDVMPIAIPKDYVDSIELPELLSEKKQRFIKTYALSEDLAEKVIRLAPFFEELVSRHTTLSPAYIAEALVSSPKQIKKKYNVEINPTQEDYDLLFEKIESGTIAKDMILDILKENKPVHEVIDRFSLMPKKELEPIVREIYEQNPEEKQNVLMGKIMKKVGSKASGKDVNEILRRLMTQ